MSKSLQIINYDKDINNNSNNIKLNSSNNTSNKNTDNKTIQSLHSNDLYNDGLMPYDEKLKNFSHKGINTFSQSTNNYRINKTNYYTNNNNTLENNTTSNILMKSKSNSNMKNKIWKLIMVYKYLLKKEFQKLIWKIIYLLIIVQMIFK